MISWLNMTLDWIIASLTIIVYCMAIRTMWLWMPYGKHKRKCYRVPSKQQPRYPRR